MSACSLANINFILGKLVLDKISVATDITNHTTRLFHIFWTSVFSLNLTNIDPDVVYSVTIAARYCTDIQIIVSSDVFYSPYFFSLNNSDPLDAVPRLITVSPRSNAEGVINGTSVAYEGKLYFKVC